MNICERLRNYKLKQNKSFLLLILVKVGAIYQTVGSSRLYKDDDKVDSF